MNNVSPIEFPFPSQLISVTTLLIVGGAFAFPGIMMTAVPEPTALAGVVEIMRNATSNTNGFIKIFVTPYFFYDAM